MRYTRGQSMPPNRKRFCSHHLDHHERDVRSGSDFRTLECAGGSKIVTSEQDLNAWKPPYSVDFLSGQKMGMASAYYGVRYENDIWGTAVAKHGPCKLPQGTPLKVHDQG